MRRVWGGSPAVFATVDDAIPRTQLPPQLRLAGAPAYPAGMAATSLIQLTQGANVGAAGQALFGVTATSVAVSNSVNTGVLSWRIDLLYAPPGSALVAGTLAFSDNGSTPSAAFTPDVTGPYRLALYVWDAVNRVGTATDADIRNFCVKEANGIARVAPQIWPRPLPPVASGEVGAKPDENNFGGQGNGWSGDGSDGLLDNVLRRVDSLAGGGGAFGGVSAGTQLATSGTVRFSNSNGISFGMSGSATITASYTVPSTAGLLSAFNASAGTTSQNLSALVFSNSNGLAFGLNGSTVTGSYTVPTQTVQTQGIVAPAAGTQTATSGTVVFANSNGLTFGMSGSSAITGSYTVPSTAGLVSAVNLSAGTTSQNLSAFVFSNSNNVSFGLNGSTVTATATVTYPAQTVQTQSNVQGISAGTQVGRTGDVVFSNSNGMSFGMAGSATVTASYTVPSTAGLISAVNLSAGTTSSNLVSAVFSNSNGMSFGLNGATITGSYTVPSTAGHISGINLSAGTTSNNLSAFTISNLNGISFGLNGSTLTASYTVPTIPAAGSISAGTTSATLGQIVFSNSNGVSFGMNAGTITATVNPGAAAGIAALGGGTQTATSGTVVFSNSNGISFGLSGSTQMTASYTVPSTAGLVSAVNISAGTTSNNASAFVFSNSNGLSFGLNGSTVTGSYTVPTQTAQTQSNIQALFDGAASISTGTVRFSNVNGVTFGINAQTITASVAAQSAQTQGVVVPSAGTQTATSGTAIFGNSNGISFGMSGSATITASYTVPSTAGLISAVNVSAGTTSGNLSAVTFSNSNGLAFGLNAGTVTGSYTVPSTAGLVSAINLSAGTTSGNASAFTFGNGNGVSFGLNAGTVTGSVAAQTAQTQSNVAGLFDGANSISTGTARFSNSNGISFGINGQTITGSHNGLTSQTNQQMTLFATSNTTQSSTMTVNASSLIFAGAGVASVGMSNGSVIVSVPSGGGGITGVNLSAGTTSQNLTNFVFADSNGLGFGLNGSTVTGSAGLTINMPLGGTTGQSSSSTAPITALNFRGAGALSVGWSGASVLFSAGNQTSAITGSIMALAAGTQTATSGTAVFSNSNGISFGMSNSSVVTASYTVPSTAGLLSAVNLSAGTTSNNASAFVFSNANGVSFGLNGSTVTGSVAAGGGGSVMNWFALGNTTQNSSSAINTASVSLNAIGALTVGYSANSIQLSAPATSSMVGTGAVSIATAGSTISIGAPAPFTKSRFNPFMEAAGLASQIGSNQLQFHPVPDPDHFQFNRMLFDITVAQTGTSGSGGLTISMWAGIYTRNASTLSLLASQSTSQGFTVSSTNSSLHSGARLFSMGWTSTMTQNDIWLGIVSRTTTSGTNQFGGISNYVASDVTENFAGHIGSAVNATMQNVLGLGVYTVTTTGIPGSVAFSQINGTNGLLNRVPLYYFLSQTA